MACKRSAVRSRLAPPNRPINSVVAVASGGNRNSSPFSHFGPVEARVSCAPRVGSLRAEVARLQVMRPDNGILVLAAEHGKATGRASPVLEATGLIAVEIFEAVPGLLSGN